MPTILEAKRSGEGRTRERAPALGAGVRDVDLSLAKLTAQNRQPAAPH